MKKIHYIRKKYNKLFAEQFLVRALQQGHKEKILNIIWTKDNISFISENFSYHPNTFNNSIKSITEKTIFNDRLDNVDNFLINNLSFLIIKYFDTLTDIEWKKEVSFYSSMELHIFLS